MIVITGAAGFIASCLVGRLNMEGFTDLVLVDDFTKIGKEKNYNGKKYSQLVHRDQFHSWLDTNHKLVQFIFHLGARTDTTEFNKEIFNRLNLQYSMDTWKSCVKYGLPLIYASSAATYGAGELGYEDDESLPYKLKPLNPYGESKNDFDKWALAQEEKPYFWIGLKFFNVYGPNEFHKGRMASVIFHTFNQVNNSGQIKLFRSHRAGFEDGKQLRDFVYVKDVTQVCYFLMHHRKNSGLYNLGSGEARSFIDLATATFQNMKRPVKIEFIDIPSDIRETYQYFTKANMKKLHDIGYPDPFYSLEDGIQDYVCNYLMPQRYL